MVQLVLIAAVVLVIAFLLKVSHVFRYYAKFTYYYVVMFFTGVFVILGSIVRLRTVDIRNIRWVGFGWRVAFSIYKLKLDVRNVERLKSDKPFVAVCNHQSGLDVIGMMAVMPENCTVLAKKELLYLTGPFGIGAWLCGLIFVDRLNRERARETMAKTVEIMHDRNLRLWIYPEGTRSHSTTMLPFKKGAFYLAVQAQVPLIPVVISSYETFLDSKKKIFNPGRIIVSCLPPISTVGMVEEDASALADRVRDQMMANYETTSAELRAAAASQ